MKKGKTIAFAILFTLAAVFLYAVHPTISIHSATAWLYLLIICYASAAITGFKSITESVSGSFIKSLPAAPLASKIFFIFSLLIFAFTVISGIAGKEFFCAGRYASLLEVKEYGFSDDMQESVAVTDIALMDTKSARIFGNRKIGSLSDVVSQYEVEEDYTQIAIDKKPMKVSALKYVNLFKWLNNMDKGVPGYVQVDPVTSEAKYIKLEHGMKYVPSAYFNYNLQRHVQFKYPTKIISGYHFEVDNDGNPYYICPTVTAKIGMFGGMDVNGVIICNPVNGDCEYYTTGSIPAWVDCVYDGDLLVQKYNWFGNLKNGFWNSIISQKGCKETTDDFGYKIIDDDVWVYTGVTSVTGDQSNIGFVLMNQRTSEAKYYKVSGADEHSAMASAEGEVQEKGYKASFPSLININSLPTYIMVLKDNAGLVKSYAMVNVEQYNIVATASTQKEVLSKYKKLIASSKNGMAGKDDDEQTEPFIVLSIEFIPADDGIMVYIQGDNRKVYKQMFKENEDLIKIAKGDRIEASYVPSEDGIHLLNSFKFLYKTKETD